MAIQDDFSISSTGDIRYTGTTANYTVIALHRWLGDLMDDAAASGNDILDITDATASERSTDNIITLINGYNIDDIAARHLYDGSVIQSNGDTIYDGVLVFSAAGTYLDVVQNGNLVSPNFWTTGLNADPANGISHRFMVKVRDAAADIDGKRLIGQTREFGFTYSEFRINGTSRGNNVMALTFATDLNNQTAAATAKSWTTITNTEGYRGIDVDNNTVNEFYYSEWNKDTFTINQFYERIKWLSKRPTVESSCADTGSDFAIGDGTITGQAQSFANGVVPVFGTKILVDLKKVGAPAGNITAKIYTHAGVFGTSSTPTGAALATSKTVAAANLTTAYQTIEFGFDTQFEMSASTNYTIAIEFSGGNVSNFVHVKGLATSGTHAGNRSQFAAAVWTATAADDLNFSIFTSPKLYGVAGVLFRGITHEVNVTAPRTGVQSAAERVSWGAGATAGTGIMVATNSTSAATKIWIQLLTGVPPSASVTITGVTSAATVTNASSPVERTLSFPLCGASTGSAIIGSYGFGIEKLDLSAADKLFDLTNTQISPPNFVTFTVGGLVPTEDRVLVGPESAGGLQTNQFTLNGALTGAAVTSVVVNGVIPTDTPSTGTIRVLRNSGIYSRVAYSSYTGSTFTVTSTDFSTDNANNGNNTYISYIDLLAAATTASFTSVYLANRSLFIRVRDGAGTPIKTFETVGSLGSAGGSTTAIRTPDI